jgi:hypothetical protein
LSNEIEAGAALATAGLAADALQAPAARPRAGTANVIGHGTNCANCGAALSGQFCGQCGQRAHLHRSLGDVFHEVLHGVTHFDGRFWTTLPMLLAPAVHMFASLRGAYALGAWEAAWRTAYISVAAIFSLSFYLFILIVLGVID